MSDVSVKTAGGVPEKSINKRFDALKRKSDDELKEQIVSLRRERFNLRFRQAQGQLEAPHHLGLARREIARIKTLQQQKMQANKKSASKK